MGAISLLGLLLIMLQTVRGRSRLEGRSTESGFVLVTDSPTSENLLCLGLSTVGSRSTYFWIDLYGIDLLVSDLGWLY
jgi:hypothetical protein